MRGFFAWEYKGKHKDLVAAFKQLLQYREDLENPPLRIVCDLNRFEVHTNFTNTTKASLRIRVGRPSRERSDSNMQAAPLSKSYAPSSRTPAG